MSPYDCELNLGGSEKPTTAESAYHADSDAADVEKPTRRHVDTSAKTATDAEQMKREEQEAYEARIKRYNDIVEEQGLLSPTIFMFASEGGRLPRNIVVEMWASGMDDVRVAILRRPVLIDSIRLAARTGSVTIKAELAHRKDLVEADIRCLAADASIEIRAIIAGHARITLHAAQALASSREPVILQALANNPSAPWSAIDSLRSSEDPAVLSGLASHPLLPGPVAWELAGSLDVDVISALMRRIDTLPPDLQADLVNS